MKKEALVEAIVGISGEMRDERCEVREEGNLLPYDFRVDFKRDKVVMMVRGPEWVYVYWEVSDKTEEKIRRRVGESFGVDNYYLVFRDGVKVQVNVGV